MEHHAAAGWSTQVMAPGFMLKGVNDEPYDPFAIDGADHWYTVGAHRVRAISNDLANQTFRSGWLRSVGPGWTNFAVESFMDEAAHKVGADPLQFRLHHLKAVGMNAGSAPNAAGGASRQATILQRAALRGLSMALHEGTRIENGNVVDRNLGAYTPLRLADVPDLEIDFFESAEAPVGLGEPGTTVIAPAIANAIFTATGARVRHLPVTGDAVLAALQD